MNVHTIVQIIGILLFFIGISGLILRDNIIKSILSLSILELGVVIFFLGINYREDQVAPLLVNDMERLADPLPQAMMITTIVIGVAVTSLSISLLNIVHRKYNTSLWTILKEVNDGVSE